jgi:Phage integrase, N-terminal SAM-like domain
VTATPARAARSIRFAASSGRARAAHCRQQERPKTHVGYRDVVRLHITPVLGKKRPTKLTTQDVRRLVARTEEKCICCVKGLDARRDGRSHSLVTSPSWSGRHPRQSDGPRPVRGMARRCHAAHQRQRALLGAETPAVWPSWRCHAAHFVD